MDGLDALIRTMEKPLPPRTRPGTVWQYHPRRGHHSELGSWGVLLDLIQESELLRSHFKTGKVVFGLDVPLRDYTRDRPKKLDLVIGRLDPQGKRRRVPHTLPSLVKKWSIQLTEPQQKRTATLDYVREGPIGSVHVAVEAKAAMTEFGKARPRLYDELNSSHQIVHGASNKALAVGLAMINVSPRFVSPLQNKGLSYFEADTVNTDQQPRQAELTVAQVMSLPRRGGTHATGYDAMGIVIVDLVNDGGPVKLVSGSPAPDASSVFNYEKMIRRVASEYDATFTRV